MSEKNGSDGLFAKILVGVAVPVLTAVIIYKLGIKDTKPETPPKPSNGTQSINPDPSNASDKPKPPSTFTPEPSLPTSACPGVQGMFWMQYPNAWYGPFAGGDAISFGSAGGFFVYNAQVPNDFGTLGAVATYADPYAERPRNVWVPLLQSRFTVCVDDSGRVFGWAQQ